MKLMPEVKQFVRIDERSFQLEFKAEVSTEQFRQMRRLLDAISRTEQLDMSGESGPKQQE